MPQRMGEPSWYYCFGKLTHQTLKKKHIQESTCIHRRVSEMNLSLWQTASFQEEC